MVIGIKNGRMTGGSYDGQDFATFLRFYANDFDKKDLAESLMSECRDSRGYVNVDRYNANVAMVVDDGRGATPLGDNYVTNQQLNDYLNRRLGGQRDRLYEFMRVPQEKDLPQKQRVSRWIAR